MKNLNEKQMRLLTGIVLDAAGIARQTKAAEDSEEMARAIEIVELSNLTVKMVNEMYPVAIDNELDIFGGNDNEND